MTLFELARELFTYLVRFREKASSTAAPPLPEVRRDLLGIFARMDNQAKRDPLLMEPYHQAHYPLVALADEVVLTSGWEHSPAWRQALLEERFYSTQEAGSRFFELAKNLDQAPQDVVAIFYLCLALGFSGRYAPADPELADVKENLLARLPSKPRIMEEPPNNSAQNERRARGWLWSAAAMAVLVAGVVLGWDYWQAAQVSEVSVSTAPASKPAPETAPVKTETSVTAKPEMTQKPATTTKTEVGTAPKSELAPKTETATQPVPAPTPQPKSEKVETKVPDLETSKAETQPKEVQQAKARKQPAETSQATPEAPAAAPSTTEEQPAAASPAPPKELEVVQAPKVLPMQKSYRIRVGVYVGPIQSGRFADKLSKSGFPVTIEKLDRPSGKVLYVVSITPLASLKEAERVRAEVKQRYKIDGVIKEN